MRTLNALTPDLRHFLGKGVAGGGRQQAQFFIEESVASASSQMTATLRPPFSSMFQAREELEAAASERDEVKAQLAAEKAAAAEVATAAEAARAALQGEVNTARQRIQAAEKARLELEVRPAMYMGQHFVVSRSKNPCCAWVWAGGAEQSLATVPTDTVHMEPGSLSKQDISLSHSGAVGCAH